MNGIKLWMGMLVSLSFFACINYPQNTWVIKVIDQKSNQDEQWEMKYDYKGRLTKYGNTPISYEGNSVVVGKMKWNTKQEKMFGATYNLSDGKATRSEALCLIKVDTIWMKVCKKADYTWLGDSLYIKACYKSVDCKQLVRTCEACYIYDDQSRIVEAINQCYDAQGVEEWVCHSYFDYDVPIRYEANLNLMAYITDQEELDIFLFFLLGMDGNPQQVLPNLIHRCVNHSEYTYNAYGLYRMEGEKLVRMELISEQIKLKERIDFQYYKE